MTNIVANREIAIPLGVIVDRHKSRHPWGIWNWQPVSVFLHANPGVEWQKLVSQDDWTRYHAATVSLILHRTDTEALCLNMECDAVLYVVLRANSHLQAQFPFYVHTITASAFEAQDFDDVADDIVGKVPMPEAVAALVQEFIVTHHKAEPFKKRRRDKLDPQKRQFGKTPIFLHHTKQ